MSELKPIETIYKGYKFRSRLEARYAVFFDALGIRWEYEKEGYDLDGVLYLPDFWLPAQQYWIEIKGQSPTWAEERKMPALRDATGYPAILFTGLPGEYYGHAYYADLNDSSGGSAQRDDARWIICRKCGKVDIDLRRRTDASIVNALDWTNITYCACEEILWPDNEARERYLRSEISYRDAVDMYPATHSYTHPRLMTAYAAAKQARFEHGAQP